MSLSQAMQDAIRANLPGQVADEMRAFIEKAQTTELELVATKSRLQAVGDQLTAKEAILSQHQEVAVREAAVDKRGKELAAKELELIKKEAAIEAAVAKAELSGVKTSMTAFLANVTIRRNVVESNQAVVQQPINGGYQPPPMTMPLTSSNVTTETQE